MITDTRFLDGNVPPPPPGPAGAGATPEGSDEGGYGPGDGRWRKRESSTEIPVQPAKPKPHWEDDDTGSHPLLEALDRALLTGEIQPPDDEGLRRHKGTDAYRKRRPSP